VSGLLASFPHGWYNEGEESLGTRGLSADGVREGSHPLALSRGCAGGNLDFQRGRFDCSGGEFGFRRNGRGALRSPTSPRGAGCERAATLSRSPGAVLVKISVSDGAGSSVPARNLISGEAERSPGAVLAGIWVFDGAGAGVLVKNLVSDETGVGRSAPLHPLGGRGARGLRPSRALPWGCAGGDLSFRRCRHSGEEFGFRRSRRGALRSPTPPRVTGCERAATLSRSLVGLCWRGFGFPTELVRAFW